MVSYPDRTMISDGANYMYFIFADSAHPMLDESFQPIKMPDGSNELYQMFISVPIPSGTVIDEDTIANLRDDALVLAKQQAKERAEGIDRLIALTPFFNSFKTGSQETVFEGEV